MEFSEKNWPDFGATGESQEPEKKAKLPEEVVRSMDPNRLLEFLQTEIIPKSRELYEDARKIGGEHEKRAATYRASIWPSPENVEERDHVIAEIENEKALIAAGRVRPGKRVTKKQIAAYEVKEKAFLALAETARSALHAQAFLHHDRGDLQKSKTFTMLAGGLDLEKKFYVETHAFLEKLEREMSAEKEPA